MSVRLRGRARPVEAGAALDAEPVAVPAAGAGVAPVTAWRPGAVLLPRLALLAAFLALWEYAGGRWIDEYFVSRPSVIGARLLTWAGNGTLALHAGATLQEALLGLVIGMLVGVLVGFLLGQSPFLARLLDPFITALYSLPKVALAPLIILWFGIGTLPKIVLAAVIVFFLVFFNTFAGVRHVDRELVAMIRLMGASRLQVQTRVILPSALPWVFVGLKVAVPYSLIGAIVGELISSNRGLGYLLQRSAGQIDTAGVLAVIVLLMAIATALNEGLHLAETRLRRWQGDPPD